MSDDNDKERHGISIPEKALEDRGAYVCFLVGTSLGVVADVMSKGITLGQGTAAGGSTGLAVYSIYRLTTDRRRLKKLCQQYVQHFSEIGDVEKEAKMKNLLQEINTVSELPIKEIEEKIKNILDGK